MTTETLQRRLLGGGLVALLVAASLLTLDGAGATLNQFIVGWLAAGGALLVVAGLQNRFPLGVATLGWPKLAAAGLAILSIGSSTVGFLQLFVAPAGLGLLNGILAVLAALVLALGALECWLGGVLLDEELFAVE
ncbi:uncharacterized protein Nmag_1267 [Natrialba magadii ATCC 43099]|uniref:Uncharacterized protein n=1 Tax=Natrialba magadii (strain ATCC 43099 / DSM 3394 / CCM 3739 / CIP 104546 / IAM 13178 / JCM 8861 / NBRC 102185 / NCIMB 2190 / MS3) TaxID=547559 RepID=D3SSC1_NATMM|nr:hypothetical protein [Natrialba magadii]ADD04847.1 uncharacterized protein Nmag_1267 [Natrialba magadii ATCC 43099]ELY24432.1 hypothetical protein C500_18855 [Natrialba magadii ATCC 43099]